MRAERASSEHAALSYLRVGRVMHVLLGPGRSSLQQGQLVGAASDVPGGAAG